MLCNSVSHNRTYVSVCIQRCTILTHTRTHTCICAQVLRQKFGIATRKVAYMASQLQVTYNSHDGTTLSRTSTLLGTWEK